MLHLKFKFLFIFFFDLFLLFLSFYYFLVIFLLYFICIFFAPRYITTYISMPGDCKSFCLICRCWYRKKNTLLAQYEITCLKLNMKALSRNFHMYSINNCSEKFYKDKRKTYCEIIFVATLFSDYKKVYSQVSNKRPSP